MTALARHAVIVVTALHRRTRLRPHERDLLSPHRLQ